MVPRGGLLAALLLVSLLVSSCGTVERKELLVSAAASLTEAFADIEEAYEWANPGVDVVLNFAGSSTLREQILSGAPVDVFASADIPNMRPLEKRGLVSGASAVFASNRLVIGVPAGNPAGVSGLGDFADEALLLGLCAEGVPCGDLARQALAKAGVVPLLDTNEPDVRALLTKIQLGELDAGVVYVTDVLGEIDVEGVEIPNASNVVTAYPIAVMNRTRLTAEASAFVDYVLSEEGQTVLRRYGFGTP